MIPEEAAPAGKHKRGSLVEAAESTPEEAGSFLDDVIEVVRGTSWRVGTAPSEAPVWIYVENERAPSATRGWKLHVSAALPAAPDVLERAMKVLLGHTASFKLAASMRVLEALNEGDAGPSQIGKFITVYPDDDEQAVLLAGELHAATEGLRGPPVLSDRPLVPGSLVHYRYGLFSDPVESEGQSAGTDQFAARPTYSAPGGVEDPFIANGVSQPDDKGLIAGRYFVTSTLHRSARGAVHLGVDMQVVRDCILKRAWRDARLTPDGVDARDQLREEAAKLRTLAGKGPWPEVLDVVEDGTDLVMVLERVPGPSLAALVHGSFGRKRPPAAEQIATWGRNLAQALGAVHENGLVYRDLNPENVIVAEDRTLSLVDFELAQEPGPVSGFYVAGTPGFLSPGQSRGEPAAFSDDIYSLGAMIVFMAIGDRPPGGDENLSRMATGLKGRGSPDVVRQLVEIAGDCLLSGEGGGARDMRSVEKRLSSIR